jgi:hypothetical protein
MLQRLHDLRRWAGIDRPVFLSVCGRAWTFLSGPITIYLITLFFTPELQGYYYTFGSVVALQALLELGFSQCIVQFASHEFVRLRFSPGGRIEGEEAAKSRLISLGRLAVKWYAVMAVLLVLGVGLGGELFFSIKPGTGISWQKPWWLLCLATGLNLTLLPVVSLLEGCNQLAFVYGLRTIVAVGSSLAMWAALSGGAGLYSGALTALAGGLITATILLRRWHGLLHELRSPPQGPLVSWRHELWPLQWKIGVSWMSGYFIFNLFTPVLFYFHGPILAGRMGMTLQLVNGLNAVAVSWTGTKGPRFGMLISQRRFGDLDRLFFTATAQALGVCMAGGVVLLLALAVVQEYFSFGGRFLGLAPTSLLVLATVINQVVYGQAIYLRAHKQEPFMGLSVASGLLTGLAVVGLGRSAGAWGACLGYMAVQIGVAIWASMIWSACRRTWHRAESTTIHHDGS